MTPAGHKRRADTPTPPQPRPVLDFTLGLLAMIVVAALLGIAVVALVTAVVAVLP